MGGIYGKVYTAMINFEKDPYPGVAILAKSIMEHIRQRARDLLTTNGPSKAIGTGIGLRLVPHSAIDWFFHIA
jgi:hypothetical protein